MSGKGGKRIKAQVPWKQYSDNWDKAYGTSTCERIAERLLEEDKVICDKLDKAADTMKQSTIQV